MINQVGGDRPRLGIERVIPASGANSENGGHSRPLPFGRLTARHYFDIRRNMETSDAVTALAALAQDNRLDVFRLLVQVGPEGMPAGEIAAKLDLAPNTLTFHFDRLRSAGLVTVRRNGRSMIYAPSIKAMNDLLAYLTENCCQGQPEKCAPTRCIPARATRARKREHV